MPLNLHFLGLENDTVTAKMLSWFIIRKLEQKHDLKHIFRPITKELKLLIKRYKFYVDLSCSLKVVRDVEHARRIVRCRWPVAFGFSRC